MAFTATERLSIIKITGYDGLYLDQRLETYNVHITSTVEDAVRDEITRWDDGAGTNFTRIKPNAQNFGAEINPGDEKADIRKNICNLLYLPLPGANKLIRA